MSRSHPEIFIIEALRHDDNRDGRTLKKILSFEVRRTPRYRFVRTKAELKRAALEFEQGSYRWLHLSCHGDRTGFELPGDHDITFEEFSKIFAGRLNKRRLFVSACETGVKKLARAVFASNSDCYSVAAPKHSPRFDESAIMWSAFYYLMWRDNPDKMKRKKIRHTLEQLGRLFPPTIRFFTWDTKAGRVRG